MEVQVPITTAPDENSSPSLSPAAENLLASAPLDGGLVKDAAPTPVDYAALSAINLADDEDLKAFVANEVIAVIRSTVDSRKEKEQEWLEIDRTDDMEHDENQKYIGESDVYLPVANNNFNTIVAQLQKGIFPSDDYFDVTDVSDTADDDTAKLVKTYAQWELETISKLKQEMKSFNRPLVKYGTSIMKWFWRHPPKGSCLQPGFVVSARNLYHWYIYPETAESIDQAVMVFEFVDMPRHEVERMGRIKKWINVDDAMAGGQRKKTSEDLDREASDKTGNNEPHVPLAEMYRVTEVWTYARLPAKARKPDEHEDDMLLVQMMIINNVPVEIRRCPHEYGRIPYEAQQIEREPGSFYGKGFGKRTKPFQYLANDFANQTNDNGIYALNPFAIINPTYLQSTPPPLAPGVVLYATDVKEALRFERPPSEQVGVGMSMMSFYMQQGQSQGGAPPVLQGGKADKTATGTQILQNNALTPLSDIVEDSEVFVLVNILRAWWALQKQYRKDEVRAAVAGAPFKIDPAQLKIQADFRWLASSQAINRAQRAQQGIQFLAAINPAVNQMLMQHGKTVNPEPLLKRIYTDGLGFRGVDKVIVPMPTAPALPGAASPTPGAPPASPADTVRSFTEQAAGADPSVITMAPGEGEEGLDVRANADQLAGDAGSSGGVY